MSDNSVNEINEGWLLIRLEDNLLISKSPDVFNDSFDRSVDAAPFQFNYVTGYRLVSLSSMTMIVKVSSLPFSFINA